VTRSTAALVAVLVLSTLAVGCAPLDDAAVSEGEVTVCAGGATVQGIDVSSWQGAIDWGAVGRSGIAFAIVRIGDGYYHDARFRENWEGARAAGLVRGAYQFFEPDEDPIAQADIVIAAVGRLGPGDLPVTIDVEAPSPGVSPGTYAARIHQWVDRVTAGTGRQPIVYTGRYYWDPYVASSDFRGLPLWHAQYTSASCPNINDRWRDWAFWQYTSSGSIAGIGGRIDRDVFNGSLADLRAFANSVHDDDGDGAPADVDCDDHDPRRFPGNRETCDGVDNDCQGGVDEGLVRSCGTDVGECETGTETCSAGAWGACRGAIDPVTESCDALDNDCDGAADEDQVCEREEAMLGPGIYGATLESDVDGDGRADACARTASGFSCLASSGHGFDHAMVGTMSMGAAGVLASARIRMADVDGDGRADVCAEDDGHLACWRSTGDGFGEAIIGPAIDAAVTSLELADVDGDGRIDACMRDGSGLTCHLASGHGFDRMIVLSALSDLGGFGNVVHFGTLRFGDVDGDGRADVCARDASGVDCWLSLGDRFGERFRGPRWSDASGFDALDHWSTIRLVDVDADGRADLCARTPDGFRCVLSEGHGFGGEISGPAMSDASGWSDASVYTTLRMADLDGDGAADVCARERDRVRCWLFAGHAFDREVLGPELSDAAGYGSATHYRSIRLADVDGDGRADLCARASEGLRCYASIGAGFDHVSITPAWADAEGFADASRTASIRIAGGRVDGAGEAALRGALGCSASPGRGPSGWSVVVLAALALVIRRRRG
jgi:uncharacterized protein (TIGR03382 family)